MSRSLKSSVGWFDRVRKTRQSFHVARVAKRRFPSIVRKLRKQEASRSEILARVNRECRSVIAIWAADESEKVFFPFQKRISACLRQVQCSKDRSFHLAVSIERILEICKSHAGKEMEEERERER